MFRLRRYRAGYAVALFALWMQALWPGLSMASASAALPLCTGYGVRYVADPQAPATPHAAHDCPCCCAVLTHLGLPAPVAPSLRLPRVEHVRAAPASDRDASIQPAVRRPWGRAPPVV